MSLNEQFYFLSPVQVVKVTGQNLEEVAEWCGGRVAETESRNPQRKAKGILDKYVWVPTPEGSKMGIAFPGMYVTKRVVNTTRGELKITWAVFAKSYFEKNYFDSPAAAVEETWAKKGSKDSREKAEDAIAPVKRVAPVINVFVNSPEEAKDYARSLGSEPPAESRPVEDVQLPADAGMQG